MYRLLLEAAEALQDLGADRCPGGDVASLRLRVEGDVVGENVQAESAQGEEGQSRSKRCKGNVRTVQRRQQLLIASAHARRSGRCTCGGGR